MGDFRADTTVNAEEGALFDYLSRVENLPQYFARMTSARPGDGEEVHTTAQLPDGSEVEGDAWFRVDDAARSIEWGAEGPHDYHGSLQITDSGGDGGDVVVEVRLHTTRVGDGNAEVQEGLETTLANIKQVVEGSNAPS